MSCVAASESPRQFEQIEATWGKQGHSPTPNILSRRPQAQAGTSGHKQSKKGSSHEVSCEVMLLGSLVGRLNPKLEC